MGGTQRIYKSISLMYVKRLKHPLLDYSFGI